MTAGFDLTPVIGLHSALSARDQCCTPAPTPAPPAVRPLLSASEQPRLGDFTALWAFLDNIKLEQPVGGNDGNKLAEPARSEPIPQPEPEPEPEPVVAPVLKPAAAVRFMASDGISVSLPTDKVARTTTAEPTETYHRRAVIKASTSASQRKVSLVQKLLAQLPETSSALLSTAPRTVSSSTDIHVFIDNSNILIGFYDQIKKARGISRMTSVKRPDISYHSLSMILERGRPTAKRVLVGSSPITREIVEARDIGYETSILERVEKQFPDSTSGASSGSETPASKLRKRKVEQAVDEVIHLKILESVLDFEPSTIVLATGDGAVGEYSKGFGKVVERCLARGWTVEVVAWKDNLSRFYRNREFKKKWKGKFRVVSLDNFVEELLA